ncbi:FAD-dependent oxidoreductase [Spelaeicoccus albus]|uniref:2-polyprenyl-6-methoxyphenol hydroxylase-like FAD-dependent oxidoreductase n=1 Tax=Spelaeicoccus albus TaxID=1280376 RepID=A0A7Z0D589_9MICO|nr:2-polyprenyl-6-methoxyphenol hydroxylase-like FAD-dependent oxidoreductase [Spelaeicoccus albus]
MTARDDTPTPRSSRTTCAIAGGGPAGLVLGLLLARAGVDVTVLEKHADFLRDFRGDTVHPTTMGLLDDLGLFDRFDTLPQSHVKGVKLPGPDGADVLITDFTRLPLRHPYIAMVPQWDLLDLIAEAASAEPSFTLLTEHEVTGVVQEGDRVAGIDYTSPDGEGRLLADLTVACDGRWSAVRRAVGLPSKEIPVDFDIWWYRVPTARHIGESLFPRTAKGRAAIVIPREGYLQIAQIGRKGTDAQIRARGIEAFRAEVAELLSDVAGDQSGIKSMDDVKHLDVRVDRLRRWHAAGVLCIGDAAHAMSPVGGVGINLAVQDAVATARLVAGPLLRGEFSRPAGDRILARVHRRRVVPTVVIQSLQRVMHSRVIMPALDGKTVRLGRRVSRTVERLPFLTIVPAFVVGVGPRPERAPAWATSRAHPFRVRLGAPRGRIARDRPHAEQLGRAEDQDAYRGFGVELPGALKVRSSPNTSSTMAGMDRVSSSRIHCVKAMPNTVAPDSAAKLAAGSPIPRR